MKSRSLEMIFDNMYFIASVGENTDEVFIAFGFEDAGRKYAELKSKGDAIIWHLRKKDLVSRVDCDLRMPIEMVSEERLLRLMSLVVVEGKDGPSVSPTVESGDPDKEEIVPDENSEAIVQIDREIEMVEDDEELRKTIKIKSWKLFKSRFRKLVRKYDINVKDLVKDINKLAFKSWFRNLPFNIQINIAINSIVLGEEEDVEIVVAWYLVKLQIQSGDPMDDILREFRETIKKSEYKDIKLKINREKRAARAVRAKIWERQQKRKSTEEELQGSTKTGKDTDQMETLSDEITVGETQLQYQRDTDTVKCFVEDACKFSQKPQMKDALYQGYEVYCKLRDMEIVTKNTFTRSLKKYVPWLHQKQARIKGTEKKPRVWMGINLLPKSLWRYEGLDPYALSDDVDEAEDTEPYGESDQKTTPGDLIDGWKEPASTLKVESGGLKTGEKEWSKEDLIIGISEILKREKGPMSRKDIISKVLDISPYKIPLCTSNLFIDPIEFLINHNLINRLSRGVYKWIGLGISHDSGSFGSFIDDWCFISPKGVTIKKECWYAYLAYSQQRDLQPISEPEIFLEMKARNIKKRRKYINGTRKTVWIGIDLVPKERRVYPGEEPITKKALIPSISSSAEPSDEIENYESAYQQGVQAAPYLKSSTESRSHDVDRPKPIPSIEVLLEEFGDRCKMRGMINTTVQDYVSRAKGFIEFVEKNGESMLDVNEQTLEAFKSHLGDDRGFKTGTIRAYSVSIRAFYDYTNSRGFTEVSEPISHRLKGAKLSTHGFLKGFADNCKMKGMKKEAVRRRISCVRGFTIFVEGSGKSILEVDEQTLKAYRSHLRDGRGLAERTIENHSKDIRVFYNYTNSKGFTDVSMPTNRIWSMNWVQSWSAIRMKEVVGNHLTRVYDDESSSVIFEEVNQRILEGIDKLGPVVKRAELMRFVLDLPKPDKVPRRGGVFIGTHLRYLMKHNILERSSWGRYKMVPENMPESTPQEVSDVIDEVSQYPERAIGRASDGEKLTDRYPRTHKGWARRAVGKDGSLSRMHIDMSNESFEPNFRYIYKGVVQKIIESIKGDRRGHRRKGEVLREVLNIPKGNEIPSGALFFIQVHLKYMVDRNLVERRDPLGALSGVYILVPVDPVLGGAEKSSKVANSMTDKKPFWKSEKDWIREILGDNLQRVDMEKQWRPLYTGVNQRITSELENKTSMSRSKLTRLLFDFEGNIPKAIRNIMDAHISYLVDRGSISRLQKGIYKLVDDTEQIVDDENEVHSSKKPPEYWIQNVLRMEKDLTPVAWISRGSIKDAKLVKRGQGDPIYPGINRRILVEIRESKHPLRKIEMARPVFNIGYDEVVPTIVQSIVWHHIKYLVYRNKIRQSSGGYYEMVSQPKVSSYKPDPMSGRDVQEVMKDLHR